MKPDWRSELLAWRDTDRQIVGTTLLYRLLPGTRRSFVYLPEGPDLDWGERWLTPLVEHLAAAGAFAVQIGSPPPLRRWSANTLKVAAGPSFRIGDVLPDSVEAVGSSVSDRLRGVGWRRCGEDGSDGDAQPRFLFQVPLAGRDRDDLWSGLSGNGSGTSGNRCGRGVEVRVGDATDLDAFYGCSKSPSAGNGFKLGRSLSYYQRQYRAINGELPGRMRLYLAARQGEVLAAHMMNVVGRRIWYQTGTSASHRREVRPNHALQWRMLQDAPKLGADYYDMRGGSDCLEPTDRAFGLLRWKLGTGGQAVETLGECGS